jgi:hypothetical protein
VAHPCVQYTSRSNQGAALARHVIGGGRACVRACVRGGKGASLKQAMAKTRDTKSGRGAAPPARQPETTCTLVVVPVGLGFRGLLATLPHITRAHPHCSAAAAAGAAGWLAGWLASASCSELVHASAHAYAHISTGARLLQPPASGMPAGHWPCWGGALPRSTEGREAWAASQPAKAATASGAAATKVWPPIAPCPCPCPRPPPPAPVHAAAPGYAAAPGCPGTPGGTLSVEVPPRTVQWH